MYFVIQHEIHGHLEELIWFHEDSTLQHEYILLSISIPGSSRLSWIRLERMGNIGSHPMDKNSRFARFQHTIAPSHDDLINNGDARIGQIRFESGAPTLIDLAHFVVIIYEEVPKYTLLWHNCRWFSRQVVLNLVKHFVPECQQKKDLISTCNEQYIASVLVPSFMGPLGFISQHLIQSALIPIAGPAVAIVGFLGVSETGAIILDPGNRKVKARVKPYLAGRPID